MPNWCTTEYTFYGSAESLKYLYDKMEDTFDTLLVKSDFGHSWLGNLLKHCGLDLDELPSNVRYRGDIVDFFLDDYDDPSNLIVQTSTAWVPMVNMWDIIIDKLYLDLSYVYTAEELGCGLLINTDTERTFYNFDYLMDISLPNIELFESMREDEILPCLNRLLSKRYKSLKQAKKRIRKRIKHLNNKGNYNKHFYMSIQKYDKEGYTE